MIEFVENARSGGKNGRTQNLAIFSSVSSELIKRKRGGVAAGRIIE